MVNIGRPSKDCSPCRRRKLRCDLNPEGCGQCRRAKIKCSGYRDPQDLVFRDQTRSTKDKVVARRAWAAASEPAALDLAWNVRARYLFFSTYITGFSHSLATVNHFYSKAPAHDHLAASIDAISLAFIAVQLKADSLIPLAGASYRTAVRSLGRALNQGKNLDIEEVVQSILLLDMYEKMIDRNPKDHSLWMSHANGGVSLLVSRANQFASNPNARQLGARLVTAVTVGCGAASVRIPDAMKTLRHRLDPFIRTVKWRFLELLVQSVDLQADISEKGGKCTAHLVERAEQLEDELGDLQMSLPPDWIPQHTSPVKPDPLIFGSHYAIYPDHYITQVTNGIRVVRLILSKILLAHASGGLDQNSAVAIEYRIRDVTHQVCATVPQFLLPAPDSDNTTPFSPLKTLQCCMLLAPLYFVHQVSADASMKDWIHSCLGYMAEAGGMKMANDVIELMRNEPDLNYWRVYATVGSYAFAA